MIDLTPLDVRKKKGDFRRGLRGYDPPHVDDFLDIVADRLESLVRENLALQERVARYENQVGDYREREKALTEALVTAQEMREEVRAQSAREADAARREAENDAVRIRAEAQQVREREEEVLRRLRGRQLEFLQTYRAFLERELAELASTVRGLELNGTMADVLMTPPRLPDSERRDAADEWATPSAPSHAATDAVSPEPTQPPLDTDPPEPELILSDDDVLSDDGDGAEAAAVGVDGVASDASAGAPQATQPPPASGRSTGDAVGAAEPELASTSGTEADRADPTPPAQVVREDDDLGLDLIPELDDFAELEDIGGDDAVRPPLDASASVEGAGPAAPDTERSTSKRRNVSDDTDDLLRSLFGDEH